MKKETNITTISIPKPLAENIKKRLKGTGFNSVSSYVTYVMRQVMSSIEEKENKRTAEVFSKKDEEAIKSRLRNLGYID